MPTFDPYHQWLGIPAAHGWLYAEQDAAGYDRKPAQFPHTLAPQTCPECFRASQLPGS